MNSFKNLLAYLVIVMYCLPANADKLTSFCSDYAKKAVSQYSANIYQNCGFSGLRWSDDEKGQQKWCETVSTNIAQHETNQRSAMLDSCLSRHNKKKKKLISAIPQECINTNDQLTKTLSPYGSKGYLTEDVNKDHHVDYLYFEKNNKTSSYGELTVCLSDKNHRYRKIQVDLGISALGVLSDSQYGDDFYQNLVIDGNKASLEQYDRQDFQHYGTTTHSYHFIFEPKIDNYVVEKQIDTEEHMYRGGTNMFNVVRIIDIKKQQEIEIMRCMSTDDLYEYKDCEAGKTIIDIRIKDRSKLTIKSFYKAFEPILKSKRFIPE